MGEKLNGEIEKVMPWKNGKGYFLNLRNNRHDFYKFGECTLHAGDRVVMEVSRGTGSFEEKLKIGKIAEESVGLQNDLLPPETRTITQPKPAKKKKSEKEYQLYADDLMHRCIIRATRYKKVSKSAQAEIGCALFRAQVKPLHYWQEENGGC